MVLPSRHALRLSCMGRRDFRLHAGSQSLTSAGSDPVQQFWLLRSLDEKF